MPIKALSGDDVEQLTAAGFGALGILLFFVASGGGELLLPSLLFLPRFLQLFIGALAVGGGGVAGLGLFVARARFLLLLWGGIGLLQLCRRLRADGLYQNALQKNVL